MALLQRAARLGQFDAVETGFAVDGRGDFLFAYDGAIASCVHGDIDGVRLLQYGTRIVGDLVEALVATDRGHADQIDVRVTHCEQDRDGVVVAGIAVQDDLPCHYCFLPLVPSAVGRSPMIS